jgi:2-keto-myo-inositol isomerase
LKPCISEATTMSSSFEEDVAHFADAGCPAMEVWLTKLEVHLEKHSLADTRKLLDDRGMTLAAAAYQGGLLLTEGEQRKLHVDHFRRRLDLCQQLNIPTLLVAADFASPVDDTTLERSAAALKQASQWAAAFDVRLALEFHSRAGFCTSLDTAAALVAQCQEVNLGINLDVFHYYTGPSKLEDFDLLTKDNLVHVQFSDLAGVPRELATDSDRVLPGDGDFQLATIVERLRAMGYERWVSLEVLNPTLWQANPVQVAEIGVTALRRIMGLTAC